MESKDIVGFHFAHFTLAPELRGAWGEVLGMQQLPTVNRWQCSEQASTLNVELELRLQLCSNRPAIRLRHRSQPQSGRQSIFTVYIARLVRLSESVASACCAADFHHRGKSRCATSCQFGRTLPGLGPSGSADRPPEACA